MSTPWLQRRDPVAAALAAVAAAAVLLAMARTLLSHVALYDELLHVLAARGILAHGSPVIAEGLYSRASLFTRLVALSLGSFGDTLVAARLPSLAGAVLLVAALGFWVTRRAGLAAGLGAAIALCLVPEVLQQAVFARFYTLHALLVLVIAIGAFEALRPPVATRRTLALGLLCLLLLPVAWNLQSSTAVAVLAVGAGIVAVALHDHWLAVVTVFRRHTLACVLAVLLLAGAGFAAASMLGLVAQLREVPVWASWAADKPWYYLLRFAEGTPLLWPLLPLAAVCALRVERRLALFCLVVFLAAFAVHSIAAAKQMRYILYALPFVAALWGMAFSWLIGLAGPRLQRVAVCGGLVAALLLSTEGQMAARLVAGRAAVIDVLPYAVEADWTPAVAVLREPAAAAARIVTSNSMKSLYYFGRYDFELNASIVAETDTGQEFGRDERTGRQAIGATASLLQVLERPGTTLVILEQESLDRDSVVSTAAVQLLARRCASMQVPETSGLRVWSCAAGPAALGVESQAGF